MVKASTAATVSPAAVHTVTIQKTGAVATPNGFLAFAVVANPSSDTATNIGVEMAEVSASGRTLARRSGTIPAIAPGQQDALALDFPLMATLPAKFSAVVRAAGWDTVGAANRAQLQSTTFLQDARTPTVRLHILDQGQAPVRLELTTVCWDGAGNIRGGGGRVVTIAPDSRGKDVDISVALSAIPARCDGYGVVLS